MWSSRVLKSFTRQQHKAEDLSVVAVLNIVIRTTKVLAKRMLMYYREQASDFFLQVSAYVSASAIQTLPVNE